MKTIKFETSIGFVEIPYNFFNDKNYIDVHDEKYFDADWNNLLRNLYSYRKIHLKNGWVIIELSDPYYGNAEYKIITEQNNEQSIKRLSSKTGNLYQYKGNNNNFRFPMYNQFYYENEIFGDESIGEMVISSPNDWKRFDNPNEKYFQYQKKTNSPTDYQRSPKCGYAYPENKIFWPINKSVIELVKENPEEWKEIKI